MRLCARVRSVRHGIARHYSARPAQIKKWYKPEEKISFEDECKRFKCVTSELTFVALQE